MVESADFDGLNDYMARGAALTGAANSKSGIVSTRIRIDGTDNAVQYSIVESTHFILCRVISNGLPGSNAFLIQGTNLGSSVILNISTATAYTQSATWLHVLASWDIASAATHLYVNDADDKDPTVVATNDTIVYTDTNFQVGAGGGSLNKVDGCLAEVYFAPGQYLDFSVTNNRRKFITSSLKPVYLGTNGAGPTGTAPAVYLHLDPSETVANFATNRGTGGDFTITGALAAGSTSPSDF